MCPSGRAPGPPASELRRAFDIIDADHDGLISHDDLKAFYSSSSFPPSATTDDEIRSMIYAADANRDGFVEFHEFERVLTVAASSSAVPMPSGVASMFENAFKVMDRDGDGQVGFGDLKACLGMIGVDVGDEDVRLMMKMGGGNESDGVDLDALLKILAVDF
ncbi:calcium-binding protein CP1 [Dioscorea cayenensis subsp. rotundata]|uniref:Calcium-binding protein CP1 n=1 Tax=Dioscorea cayennensis subsp. rotundata TaxID=55577 RepID=A0AB40BPQ5_DIOCR|nr:calcium-binding protein CP1 [Dioscorea cayenensis subsp. rotundata]